MNKYQNGKIYKLTDNTNGNIYIGSTTQTLNRRLQKHRASYNCYLNPNVKQGYMTSFNIIKNNDYKIELICDYPCDTNRQLEEKEQEYIDMYDCINKSWSYGNDLEKYKLNIKKHTLERSKKKYICECGCEVLLSNKSRHIKTKKHIKFIHSS